ncbi:adenosine receptor A3-like isoform X2 [Oculina patagonica]
MDMNSWNIVWSLCFGLLATFTVVGNVLTISVFLKKRLRKRAHFLLISLAVADLLVGLLTVPLYIVINTILYLGRHFFLVYTFIDILTGITSIYTLAVISLERMYAIGWPVRHRTLNLRVYMFAIVTPWILAAIFTSLFVMQFLNIIAHESFMYSLILFQSTPLLAICAAYCVIWRKQKSPTMGNQNHVAREARLAKTLLLITGASLLTWIPFQILNLLVNFGATRHFLYFNLTLYIIKIIQFSNSLVNVIIYPLRISEFKNGLLQTFHCCVVPCQRRNEVVPLHQVRLDQLHHSSSTMGSQP